MKCWHYTNCPPIEADTSIHRRDSCRATSVKYSCSDSSRGRTS